MRLDQLRDYLTMPEVAAKWRATDPEMCRAVLKGLLRPSLYLDARLRRAVVNEAGELEAAGGDVETVRGWHYLTPIQQVGALDCRVQTVAVLHATVPGTVIWLLERPLDMRDLMAQAVVMAEDLTHAETLLEAECHWQQRSGKTKEFRSVLNVLSIVLAEAYRYDPRLRSQIPREITEAGEQHGIPVSAGTVAKWIKEAIEQFPPSYMDRAVPKAESRQAVAAEMN